MLQGRGGQALESGGGRESDLSAPAARLVTVGGVLVLATRRPVCFWNGACARKRARVPSAVVNEIRPSVASPCGVWYREAR
jgi:hypothetical protein